MDKITPTDQREFNLLEYELLEIDFKLADFEFFFKFSREYRDDPQADLYVANYSDSSPSQMLTCKVPIPAKSDLMKFEADFTIPAGESVDVKFSFRSHPLFIVRINAQDSSIWFLTYDLVGNELSPFCMRKPEVAAQESEPVHKSAEAIMPKAKTLSVGELLTAQVLDDEISGDLERVVDDIALAHSVAPVDAAGNLIRIMTLLEKSEGDARDILIEKVINYAYARTDHHAESLEQFKSELFRVS